LLLVTGFGLDFDWLDKPPMELQPARADIERTETVSMTKRGKLKDMKTPLLLFIIL
jgi:hypothetical protein